MRMAKATVFVGQMQLTSALIQQQFARNGGVWPSARQHFPNPKPIISPYWLVTYPHRPILSATCLPSYVLLVFLFSS